MTTGSGEPGSTGLGNDAERVPSVFVSYRRSEAKDTATSLAQHLRDDVSSRCVFRDEDDLIGGQDWKAELESAMARSDTALVLVGAEWAGSGEPGFRRIDQTDDPVRNEVRRALDADARARPVPILLDGAEPPPELPEDIAELFDSLHRVDVQRADLESGNGEGYQKVLVSVWEGLRARIPNGFLVIGAEGDREALDAFVQELKDRKIVDEARSLSRCYGGAYVLSRRESKKALKTAPDAVILVDEDADDQYLLRVAAFVGLKTTRDVKLLGSGAAAACTVIEGFTGGAATKATVSTVAEAVASVAPTQTGLGATWAGLGLGGKVASAAAVATVAIGGAVAIPAILSDDGTVGAQFPDNARLEPSRPDDIDAFPLGAPAALQIELDSPIELDAAAADDYFGNFEGGAVEQRRLRVRYDGTTYDLGPVVVPLEYPTAFLERNSGPQRRLTSVTLDDVAFVEAGTGAYSPCFYEGTGDTVGGWRYTGESGSLEIALLFTSDGDALTDLAMRATFEAPATVEFDEELVAEVIPPDVDINDRCTPLESAESFWIYETSI